MAFSTAVLDRLRARIRVFDGSPRLSTTFESSVPGLHFVGLASAQSFGPVMRFVYGARHAATILTRRQLRQLFQICFQFTQRKGFDQIIPDAGPHRPHGQFLAVGVREHQNR